MRGRYEKVQKSTVNFLQTTWTLNTNVCAFLLSTFPRLLLLASIQVQILMRLISTVDITLPCPICCYLHDHYTEPLFHHKYAPLVHLFGMSHLSRNLLRQSRTMKLILLEVSTPQDEGSIHHYIRKINLFWIIIATSFSCPFLPKQTPSTIIFCYCY